MSGDRSQFAQSAEDRFFAALAAAKSRIPHGGLERAAAKCGLKRANQWTESALRKPGTQGRFSPEAVDAVADEAGLADHERIEFFFAWMLWRLESSPLAPAIRTVLDGLREHVADDVYRRVLGDAYRAMRDSWS